MTSIAKYTVVVASGKGGVGKSTVTTNIAIALAQQGKKIALLDADIYGPSIPIMLGLRRLSPKLSDDGRRVLPIAKFGVRCISPGFFMEESQSVVWRGPLLHTTLRKMLFDVDWGDVDLLLIDLPPGTGDVPLSLSQLTSIDGAVVVTTPQEVAMLDAIKAINALHHIGVPLLGVVENMAGFRIPGGHEIHHIFGEGKGTELAQRFNAPLLASIPLEPTIRIGGDEGRPAALYPSQTAGEVFSHLARAVDDAVAACHNNPFSKEVPI